MKYELEWGKCFRVELDWQHLHIIYGLMAFLAKFIPQNHEFHHYFAQVEVALKRKIQTQEELKHIHSCKVCNGFIDDRKDRFHHQIFESGYEEYKHIECPHFKEMKWK